MSKVKDMSMDDLEYLIEQKVLEILGSFDSGIDPHAASQHQMKMKTEFNIINFRETIVVYPFSFSFF